MVKKEKEFKVWADKQLKVIQKLLNLQSHKIDPIKKSDDDNSYCIFRYPYKDIEIQYGTYPYKMWLEGKKEESFGILLHEMVHVLTDPLYAKGTSRYVSKNEMEDEREALTDHITNIVMKLK